MPVLSRLRGVIEEKSTDTILLMTGGLGFEIQVPLSTLSRLPDTGQPAELRTYLHVREGALGLYGFLTQDERRIFELLIGVSGIGPRSALNCLSLLSVDQLTSAIAAGDTSALQRVPGLGRKTADRIVLELKSRVQGSAPAAQASAPAEQNDVLAALMFYGYTQSEATAAVASLPRDESLTIEERTLRALQFFAPKSGERAAAR